MNLLLNALIIICLITTFVVLMLGLFHSARSGGKKENKINQFMRYRVAIQFVSLLILTLALYYKT